MRITGKEHEELSCLMVKKVLYLDRGLDYTNICISQNTANTHKICAFTLNINFTSKEKTKN